MGIPFKSADKSNRNSDDSNNSGTLNSEIFDSPSVEMAEKMPKSTEPAQLELTNGEIATVEVIPLPSDEIKPKQLSIVKEFFRQLIGITPGLLMLLITGMQLCWAVTEFDMAVYKKMYSDSIYKIGMLIVCGFYIGAIFGQFIGSILVIHLKKKFIYLVCAFLLIVCGEFLKNCYEVPFHVIGRTLLGLVHSIVQLTVITYSSEATTKNIRSKLLSSLAFVNMLSIWMGTGLAFGEIASNEDENPDNSTLDNAVSEYVVDDLDIISISGMAIMLIAIIALILTPFITRESIPFLVRGHSSDIAYKQFIAIRQTDDDDTSSVDKFEDWKNSILIHPKHSMHIFQKENLKSLTLLGHIRILSLLFNSIFVSVMFTRLLLFDEETNVKWFYNETMSYDMEELQYSLDVLVGFKTISFVCGLLLLMSRFKLKVDRSCYKLAFIWGLSAFVVYVVYSCMDSRVFKPPPPNVVLAVFVYLVMTIYIVVPFKFDILQYEQIAQIYDEGNNNYKVWSLAFVGCLQHLLHILLLLNVFLFPSLGALLTDFGVFYISLWLLRNGFKEGAVCPFKERARKEAYSEFTKY